MNAIISIPIQSRNFSNITVPKINDLLKNANNVGVIKNSKPISGFAGKNTLSKLNNSMIFGHENFGKGNIIYFADNPLFRSFWENGKLFFANSIFFVD